MNTIQRFPGGVYTALVTPFKNGKVDDEALAKLIEHQIVAGVDGIVAVGTTGESPTLGFDEHIEVIAKIVKLVKKRILVIAGTGANSTAEALHLTREAEKVGADGLLQVAPYYNKPTQEGLYRHFLEIAQSTSLPIMLYSIPSRCGVEIGVDTIGRLVESAPNIIAIKEAGGNVDRVSQIRATVGERIQIFSGDDSLTLPFMACGAIGVVSVASNLVPEKMVCLVRAFLNGNSKEALRIHEELYPLFKALTLETNPIPIKAAMALKGWIQNELRLPLVPISESNLQKLKTIMIQCGIL